MVLTGTKKSGTIDTYSAEGTVGGIETVSVISTVYNYDFYYLPLGPDLLEELAIRVAARRQKNAPDESCLGITSDIVKSYNIGPILYMYGFIWDPAFPEDEASGAIQIGTDGIYITDLCRNFTENRTRGPSPIKILMRKFDDIVKNKLRRRKVRLMVLIKENGQPKEGSDKLIEIYQKYGFEKKNVEPYNNGEEEQLIMEKRLAEEPPTKTKSVKKATRTSRIVTKAKGGTTRRRH
jgi:hypothetical protein